MPFVLRARVVSFQIWEWDHLFYIAGLSESRVEADNIEKGVYGVRGSQPL